MKVAEARGQRTGRNRFSVCMLFVGERTVACVEFCFAMMKEEEKVNEEQSENENLNGALAWQG